MSWPRSALASAWGVLQRPEESALSTFPLSQPDSTVEIRAALDGQGNRHILISGSTPETLQPRTGVLSISHMRLAFSGPAHDYLDVACTDPKLNEQFDELALDVMEACVHADRPVETALQVVERWRRLLRTVGMSGLHENERVGLFAELSVFLALGSRASASSWTGPLRAPHDFELEHGCLEVKGCSHGASSIWVHGADQLDEHHGRPLALVLATVERVDDGQSIADLVQQLEAQRPHELSLIRERLAAAKYNVVDGGMHDPTYALRHVTVIPVEANIPRLVGASFVAGAVPSGVGMVDYEVDIAQLRVHGTATLIDQFPAVLPW